MSNQHQITSDVNPLRWLLGWVKFLIAAFTLWILSGAIFWQIRPFVLGEGYMTIFAAWFIGTCIATWAIGQVY